MVGVLWECDTYDGDIRFPAGNSGFNLLDNIHPLATKGLKLEMTSVAIPASQGAGFIFLNSTRHEVSNRFSCNTTQGTPVSNHTGVLLFFSDDDEDDDDIFNPDFDKPIDGGDLTWKF
jgi:hypothetical protein